MGADLISSILGTRKSIRQLIGNPKRQKLLSLLRAYMMAIV